ncbi:MAG: AMP-binding protein [Planctomycetales bacterium]|nr:AMP-binding protein [Planctomycetales bacterium]
MSATSAEPTTIVAIYADRIADSADQVALWIHRDERFQSLSWGELHQDVVRWAAGLQAAGVAAGDRVLQLSENRYEWIVADLAIQLAGGVHVPVHAPLTGPQIGEQLAHSGARVVLLSTADQAAKLAGVAASLPSDVRYFCYEACDTSLGSAAVSPIEQLARDTSVDEAAELVANARSNTTPETLSTILYTSGTTGEPKGVMLTQGNLAFNALATIEAFGEREDDVRLNFLPLSHIFARTCDLYTWIARGSQLALAQSRETVVADCVEVRPTLLNGVPYFYDRVYRYLCEQGLHEHPGVLRKALGDNVRMCCSGGAALPDHLFDYFASQQLPLLQGYGLTETSPVISLSSEANVRRGAVGKAIPGVELRIADDGEIQTRGPHVMEGYYRNEHATRETIDADGWLHTGDLGHIDDDGFLFITGRRKEILVTSGGKNVAPVWLESLLTQDPLILQALVVGDGRNFLAALIVPNPDNLRAAIIREAIPVSSREEALAHPRVLAMYEAAIAERLRNVSYYEQVRKFRLLDRGFTIESGELTPKMSLRRGVIETNFAAEIAAMYASSSDC